MGLFNCKSEKAPLDNELEKVFVEVVPSKIDDKKKFRKAAEEAKAGSEKLNNQLLANGFTIKIFVAAGGKHNGRKK